MPPLLDLVNDLIDRCLQAIESPDFTATIGDLVKLIRLRLTVKPLQPAPTTARWVDRIPSDVR